MIHHGKQISAEEAKGSNDQMLQVRKWVENHMQTRCSTHSVVADECSCVFSVFSKILSEPPDSQNPKSVCKLHKFLVMFGTQVETEKVSPSNEGQTQHAQFQTEDWLYIYIQTERNS